MSKAEYLELLGVVIKLLPGGKFLVKLDDYDREINRKFNFYAIIQGLYFITSNSIYNNYMSN